MMASRGCQDIAVSKDVVLQGIIPLFGRRAKRVRKGTRR
jgi:hypothetical protein